MATATKNGLRDMADSSFNGFRIDPRKIEVEKGHNVRDFSLQENQEHVSQLSASIAALGVQNPLVVRYEKGRVILVDGECRLRATMKAIKEGAEIKTVPVITEPAHTSEEDRIIELLTRNTGKRLNMLERGEVFARLKNFGWSDADIARKTGITGAHVSNIMTLHAAPVAVKTMVAQGQIAPSEAVQAIRDHGDEAPKILKEAAKATYNGKVTAKHLQTVTPKVKKEKRNPLAFGRRDALSMFAALCDIYFSGGDRRSQGMARNVFEDIIGSDWKTVAHAYHKEHNEG